MICDCQHEQVCQYKPAIERALTNVIEPNFGGPHPGSIEITQWVSRYCRYRTPYAEESPKTDA